MSGLRPNYVLKFMAESDAPRAADVVIPGDRVFSIGRGPRNDLALPSDGQLSTEHFRIRAASQGCLIEDLGSSNGLFLNGRRIQQATAIDGDEIRAGQTVWILGVQPVIQQQSPLTQPKFSPRTFPAGVQPPHDATIGRVAAAPPGTPTSRTTTDYGPDAIAPGLRGVPAAEDQMPLQLQATTGESRSLAPTQMMSVGRTNLADWVFAEDAEMSSRHMEFFSTGGQWYVKDCQSSNGTFVNDLRVTEKSLSTGDEIRAGRSRFDVVVPATATREHPTTAADSIPPISRAVSGPT